MENKNLENEVDSTELMGFKVLHVGINANGEDDAWKLAETFKQKMGFLPEDKGLGIFASPLIEIMKQDGPGTKGHIAVGCRNLEESVKYLESRGMAVDKVLTKKYDPEGKARVVYLEGEIGGFAIHLKEYKA